MPQPQPARRTRSRSDGPRQGLQAQPTHDEHEVIVISSDDEAPPVVPRKRPAPKKPSKPSSKAKAKSPTPVEGGNVLEIYSDDEEVKRRRSSRTVEEMERQIKKLKDENEQLRRQQVESSENKPQGVANNTEEHDPKHKALLNKLDDTLCCDICAGKMWSPATLACGHTFCRGCLQDWFSTALMKHLNNHPNYTMHTPRVRQLVDAMERVNLTPRQRRILEFEAHIELDKQAQPDYTCPACRVTVKSRPTEVFSLKAVTQVVAEEMGEREPYVQQPFAKGKNDGPWDGFFLKF